MKKEDFGSKEYYCSSRKSPIEKCIHEILGILPNDWPPPFRLSTKCVENRYRELVKILERHNFFVEFAEAVPVSEVYRYLTEIFLHDKDYELNDGWRCSVTGCGGDCPSCFQREYCDLVTEIWTQEEMERELVRRCETTGK